MRLLDTLWPNYTDNGKVSTIERKPVGETGLRERRGRYSNPRNPKGFGMTYPKKQLGLYDPLAEAKKHMKEREAADTIKVDDPFS